MFQRIFIVFLLFLVCACGKQTDKARQQQIDDSLQQLKIRDSLKQIEEKQTEIQNSTNPLRTVITNKLKQQQFLAILQSVPELEKKFSQGDTQTYTLFIPTDSAFKQLNPAQLEKLKQPKEAEVFVKQHIVEGYLTLMDVMSASEVVNLNQKKLPIMVKGGKIAVGKSVVVASDVPYLSGILHSIDKVIQ